MANYREIFKRTPLFRKTGTRTRNTVPTRTNPEEKENDSAQ
jgi:hypothetical protein